MSDFKFATPTESIGLQFWKLYSLWQKKISKALAAYKITHTQFVILATIRWFEAQGQQPSQAEIVQTSGIEKMTLSKAIIRLEEIKLVKRNKSSQDTRAICVSLTGKGEGLIPNLLKIIETIDSQVFDTESKLDRVALTRIMTELNERTS